MRQQSLRADAAAAEVKKREEAAALHQAQLWGLQQQLADVRKELEAAQDKAVKEQGKRQKAEEECKVGDVLKAGWGEGE